MRSVLRDLRRVDSPDQLSRSETNQGEVEALEDEEKEVEAEEPLDKGKVPLLDNEGADVGAELELPFSDDE